MVIYTFFRFSASIKGKHNKLTDLTVAKLITRIKQATAQSFIDISYQPTKTYSLVQIQILKDVKNNSKKNLKVSFSTPEVTTTLFSDRFDPSLALNTRNESN